MEFQDIREGVSDAVLLVPLYLPVAMSYTTIARMAGLSPFETILWSMVTFAGLSQMASLAILLQGGGLLGVLITSLIINLRHSFVSLGIASYLDGISKKKLGFFAFGVTTSSAGLVPKKASRGGSILVYGFSTQFCQYAQWVGFTSLGVYLGATMPLAWNRVISFGAIAAFIGMAYTFLEANPRRGIVVVLSSGFVAIAFEMIFSPYFALISGTVIGALLALLLGGKSQ